MIKYLLLLLVSVSAMGADIRELSIDYNRFHDGARSLQLPRDSLKEGVSLNLNLDLIGPIFWRNKVTALTSDAQYRYISWGFAVGVQITRHWNIGYEHLSQHLLDTSDSVYPGRKFPVQDSLWIKWTILGGSDLADPLF